jgi:hypothetical protein
MTLRRLFQSFPMCVALAVGQAPPPSNLGGSVLLSPVEFTEASLLRRCRPLQTNNNVSFVDFWFFSSRDEESNFLLGKPGNYCPYETWRTNYERAVSAHIRIAEFVRIGGSSILLIRHPDATVTRRVLSGEDPLLLSVNGTRLNLLHFTTTPLQAGSSQSRILVYAQTAAAMKPDLGAAALEALVGKLPFSEVILQIRGDPWFINDAPFPVLPPFWPEFPPPTKEQYRQSPQMFCSLPAPGAPKCVVSSRHDY